MEIVFIINPTAGNGAAFRKWRKFSETIDFPYEQFVTRSPGHAFQLVEQLKQRERKTLVIGFGGDGTMREIAAAAAGAELLFIASVPAGSGNDFARSFSCFSKAQEIGHFLACPRGMLTDIGQVGVQPEQLFASSAGIGFDAAVAHAVNRSRTKLWLNKFGLGKLAYLIFVVTTLFTFEKFRLTVESNEAMHHFEDVWLATVSNQPYFGGGMKISPHSSVHDGQLELTVVHGLPRLKLLAVFGTVFSGSHTKFPEVVQFSGKHFSLAVDRPVPRHVDGDDAGMADAQEPLRFRVSAKQWQQAKL
ncbi:diacylglycerol kinase family lipid kinase [Planococcus sp. A6]|uniref:diacylglycerol/lipid kinase family protein n=1 Tax=Planococcus sp. A6 TaxID=2992760 RepID=UPI00237B2672|nr:diacylglycerol kinase family protein [Planococcus sp. A6]MDE0583777.1 diacylglycerol kinase family lipid kinase [Planococcus sp. A6]